jgi:alpha-L-fucosidase
VAQPGNEPLAEKGHTSQRDVLRDMITAVKAKGIKVFFYTQAWEDYTLSAADQAATGWGPTFNLTTWNSFIN